MTRQRNVLLSPTVVPQVIAHRGASAEAPENTLAALRQAVAIGADRVEVDVQRTKDGALVLLHDKTLDRTTNVRLHYPRRAPWRVGDFTLAEISRLDAGSWWGPRYAGERVPTLEEAVGLLRPTGTGLLLELKAPSLHAGLATSVAHTLRSIPGYLDRAVATGSLTVQSFDHAAVREHQYREPSVPVGALGAPSRAELGALATWAAEVNPAHRLVTASFVEAVHRHGMRCHPWTVDRPAQVRRLLALGVDGVITNQCATSRQLVNDLHDRTPSSSRY